MLYRDVISGNHFYDRLFCSCSYSKYNLARKEFIEPPENFVQVATLYKRPREVNLFLTSFKHDRLLYSAICRINFRFKICYSTHYILLCLVESIATHFTIRQQILMKEKFDEFLVTSIDLIRQTVTEQV